MAGSSFEDEGVHYLGAVDSEREVEFYVGRFARPGNEHDLTVFPQERLDLAHQLAEGREIVCLSSLSPVAAPLRLKISGDRLECYGHGPQWPSRSRKSLMPTPPPSKSHDASTTVH